MTELQHLHPEKELTDQEVDSLLKETVLWIDRLIQEKPFPDQPMVGRATIIDPESDVIGSVTVGDLVTSYMLEYREHNQTDSSQDIVIEFSLTEDRDGTYQLRTSGEQPDVGDMLLEEDVDDETFAKAIQASQKLQEESEQPATQEQIKKFHTIVEPATFGDEKFDFDTFQWQYDERVDDLRKGHNEGNDT